MKVKTLGVASAMVLAIAISTPALAQVTIGGIEVPEDQVGLLQEHCDTLNLEAAGGLVGEDGSSMDESSASDEAPDDDEPANTAQPVQEGHAIDFAAIDLQACMEGGLIVDGSSDAAGESAQDMSAGGSGAPEEEVETEADDAADDASGEQPTVGQ